MLVWHVGRWAGACEICPTKGKKEKSADGERRVGETTNRAIRQKAKSRKQKAEGSASSGPNGLVK